MAAEQELAVVKPFNMANELCIWLKTLNVGDCKQIEECAFVRILSGLGQPKVESLIASLTPTSELISYLTIYLARCLLRYIKASIFTKYNRFPYDAINHWFPLVEDKQERDQPVQIMNVNTFGQEGKCYTTEKEPENGFSDSLENDTFELFFHGTEHQSAQDIIEYGINLKKGAKSKDFSHGDGFYLGKSFDEAFEWPKKRYKAKVYGPKRSAVLVFRVARHELRGNGNENGLDLQDLSSPMKKGNWCTVVRHFRSGTKAPLDFEIDVHFIEGPMASPGSLKLKNNSYQLCIRKENCVKLFNRSLHSVVFFDQL